MTFSFTPSADSYPGSRQGRKTKVSDITLKASLKNGRGNDCADQVEKVYGSDYSGSQTELQVGIKNTCKDPTVTLSLTDETGKVLDEKSFAIETQSKDKSSEKALIIFGIVILILLIFYVVAGVVSKKKKDEVNLSSFIFLLIFSTVFISGMITFVSKVEADQTTMELPSDFFDIGGTGGTGTPTIPASSNVNLDKEVYGPNDPIIVTSTFTYDSCNNASANVVIEGYVNAIPGTVATLFNSILLGGDNATQYNNELVTPEDPGAYKLVGTIYLYPVWYTAIGPGSQILVSQGSFIVLKQTLFSYITTNKYYTPLQQEILSNRLSNVTNLSDLRSVLLDYDITPSEVWINELVSNNPATSKPFENDFTVVAPTTAEVNVTIKNESGAYVEGPVTKSVGQDVFIKWTTNENATSCECTCRDPGNPDDEQNKINCGDNTPFNSSCGRGITSVEKTIMLLEILNLRSNVLHRVIKKAAIDFR